MNEAVVLLLLLTSVYAHDNEDCKIRFLSKPTTPSRLNFNLTAVTSSIFANSNSNFSDIARLTLSTHPEILGLILKSSNEQILALNVAKRLRIFPNKTTESEVFWTSGGNYTQGWTPAFKTCHFLKGNWFYGFVAAKSNFTAVLFLNLYLNQCDDNLEEIFGRTQKCDQDTTYVSNIFEFF